MEKETGREIALSASAVVVAAGSGVRMKGPVRKQYLHLQGRPVLARALSAFIDCEKISRIFLAVPEQDFDFVRKNVFPYCRLDKKIEMIPGGKERQNSVYKALRAVEPNERYVVVHDGVRPFATPSDIEKCLEGARLSGACILGIPAKETLKKAGENNFVETTLDRENVWLAQTPQAFDRNLLLQAHETAIDEGYIGTDDASLAERIGAEVRIVEGSPFNIKITTPDDLIFADFILNYRQI